jgi:hypothetical protein
MPVQTPRQPRRPPANLVALAAARQRGLLTDAQIAEASRFVPRNPVKTPWQQIGTGNVLAGRLGIREIEKRGGVWETLARGHLQSLTGKATVLGAFFGSGPNTVDVWDTFRGVVRALTLLGRDPGELRSAWKAGGQTKQDLRLLAKTVYLYNAQLKGKMPKKAAAWAAKQPALWAQVSEALPTEAQVEQQQREALAAYQTQEQVPLRGERREGLFEGPPWTSYTTGPPGGISKRRGARATIIGGGLGRV